MLTTSLLSQLITWRWARVTEKKIGFTFTVCCVLLYWMVCKLKYINKTTEGPEHSDYFSRGGSFKLYLRLSPKYKFKASFSFKCLFLSVLCLLCEFHLTTNSHYNARYVKPFASLFHQMAWLHAIFDDIFFNSSNRPRQLKMSVAELALRKKKALRKLRKNLMGVVSSPPPPKKKNHHHFQLTLLLSVHGPYVVAAGIWADNLAPFS